MAIKKKKKKKLTGKKYKLNKFTKKSKKQSNIAKLSKLVAAKQPANTRVPPMMKYVQENTMRAVNNLVTRPKEFVFTSGKPVPRGMAYHCHYTNNFEEFFMTGGIHNPSSEFIYKVDKQSDITAYVTSNGKPQKLGINPSVTKPTTDDYQQGYLKRYFAKKINEDSRPFEIARDDMGKSALYRYVSVVWFIKGSKQSVLDKNILSVARAESKLAGVGKLLPDFQFFKNQDISDQANRVRDLLGIPKDKVLKSVNNTVLPEESDKNNQQTPPAGFSAADGPPPGFTGGSGGSSGGSGGGGGY